MRSAAAAIRVRRNSQYLRRAPVIKPRIGAFSGDQQRNNPDRIMPAERVRIWRPARIWWIPARRELRCLGRALRDQRSNSPRLMRWTKPAHCAGVTVK